MVDKIRLASKAKDDLYKLGKTKAKWFASTELNDRIGKAVHTENIRAWYTDNKHTDPDLLAYLRGAGRMVW